MAQAKLLEPSLLLPMVYINRSKEPEHSAALTAKLITNTENWSFDCILFIILFQVTDKVQST